MGEGFDTNLVKTRYHLWSSRNMGFPTSPSLSHWGLGNKMETENNKKIILDLCGGTGSWSKPYKEAGYDVKVISLPIFDVLKTELVNGGAWFKGDDCNLYIPIENVAGILAAPPCTHFAGSGAQYWKQKDLDGRTDEALAVVDMCLDIIGHFTPRWYAIENPVGRLRRLRAERLGEPKLIFNPCDYGDPYTKKTLVWGEFILPTKNLVKPLPNDKQQNQISMPTVNGKKIGWNTELAKELRSITPQGFAQAFFEANP